MTRLLVRGLVLAMVLSAVLPNGAILAAPPASPQIEAREALERFLALWRVGDHERRHAALAVADRARYTRSGFVALHQAFEEAIGVTGMRVAIGSPRMTARAPEPARWTSRLPPLLR
jgi:hypothetical protein